MRILGRPAVAVRRIVDLGLLALIVVVLVAMILGKGAPLVGRQSFVIGGGSMEPTIPLGAAIVIEPVTASELAVGDVVSLQVGHERTTFTHRIITVVDRPDGRWIRTKGDANGSPDPELVPASTVLGRVELSIPLVGYLLALLSMPVGVIFVLGLAATLLAIAWLLESLEPDPAPRRGASRPGDLKPDLGRGEPIAVRPRKLLLVGPVPPIPHVARPTVREQLDRSRAVRRRRARWSDRDRTNPD